MLVGKPYKGNLHSLAIGHLLYEHLFLQAVGLAYLSLHAVAINGMMEPFLRNANEHLDGLLPFLALSLHIHGPKWKDGQRLALVPTEEFLYQFLADDSLLFLKTCWSRHLYINIKGN